MAERSSFSTDVKALLGALVTVAIILALAYFGLRFLGSEQANAPGESAKPTLVAYQPTDAPASEEAAAGDADMAAEQPDQGESTGEMDAGPGPEAGEGGEPGAAGGIGEPGGEGGPGGMDPDAMATAVAQGTEFPGRPGGRPGATDAQGATGGIDPAARMTAIAQGTLMPGGRPGDNIIDDALAAVSTPSPSGDGSMQAEPEPTTDMAESAASESTSEAADAASDTPSIPTGSRLFGVARGSGATLYDEPEGSTVVDLAAGASVSGIARSVDGSWVLLQVADDTGWAQLNQLVMYGAENLPVFEGRMTQPAEVDMGGQVEGDAESAMQPATETEPAAEAEPSMVATEAAPATPTAEQVVIKPIMATVDSQFNRLNVRSGPGTDFDIVERLSPGSEVVAVGRTADSEWLQLALPDATDGSGWVSADFVSLNDAIEELPVTDDGAPEEPLFLMPTPTPSMDSSAQSMLEPTPSAEAEEPAMMPTPVPASQESSADTKPEATRSADALILYAGPSTETEVVKLLEAGLELLELERSEDGAWARVAVLDPPGGVGWVDVLAAGLDASTAPTESEPEMAEPESTPEPESDAETGMEPSSDEDVATAEEPVEVKETPIADATTDAPAGIPAIVISEDTRLNVRAQPDTEADILVKVDPGDILDAVAINLAGDWIQVNVPGEEGQTGWVAAEFVDLGDQADALEVIIPEVTIDRSEIPLVAEAKEMEAEAELAVQAVQAELASQATLEPPKYLPVVGTPASAVPDELSGTLVFVAVGGGSIYGYDLESGALWPITTGFDPAVSPDGGTVAFTRVGGDKGLYLVDIDGQNERLIFSGNQRLASPKWSPDGQWISFSFGYDSDKCYLMGYMCIPVEEWGDHEVPDDVTQTTLVNYHIGVVDPNGQDYHEVSSLNYARTPDWNEAGIVYQSNAGLQRTTDENGATSEKILFDPLKPFYNDPDWQPNGGKIVYMVKEASHWELYEVNPDGTGETPITKPATALVDEIPSNVSPAWSPDGNSIVFVSNRTDSGEAGPWRLWVMDAGGGNQRPLGIDIPICYSFGDEQVVSWSQ